MSTLDAPAPARDAVVDDVVRLTVTARSRSADLTLPALLPLAEVLPGVVRALGVHEADEVHGGYRVHTADGRELELERTLGAQRVAHGTVLTVRVGVDEPTPKVYDDVVEAVADVVEDQVGGWTPDSARHTMLAVAAVLALLGAWTLATAPLAGTTTTVVAGAVALVATVAAVVLARLRQDVPGALVLLGLALAFVLVAATGGAVRGPGAVALVAGLGAAVVGGVGLAVLGHRAWLLLPAVSVGLLGTVVGVLVGPASLDASQVLLVVVVLLVLAAGLVPRYALQLTRTAPPPLQSEAEVLADPEPIDPQSVRHRMAVSADLVHGLRLTVVTLHVIAAPVIAPMNPLALATSLVISVLLILAARRDARTVDIVVSVAGGVLAVVTATVAAVLAAPGWAPALAVLAAVAATVVLIVLAFPPRTELVPARVLDVAETVLLLVLVPLTVLALGVIPFS